MTETMNVLNCVLYDVETTNNGSAVYGAAAGQRPRTRGEWTSDELEFIEKLGTWSTKGQRVSRFRLYEAYLAQLRAQREMGVDLPYDMNACERRAEAIWDDLGMKELLRGHVG